MKTKYRLLSFGLLLGIGLWACQDQVVTPDVQPSFAKGGNKPPKPPPDGGVDLHSFVLTTRAAVTEGIGFNLEVTALKKRGKKGTTIATGFTGTVDLEANPGTISPTNIQLTEGVGTALVTLDAAGSQTVTALLDETTGELALDVAERFAVPGRIAFCSDRGEGDGVDLWMLQGEDLVRLTYNDEPGWCRVDLAYWAWSPPEGAQVAYKTSVNGVKDIYVHDPVEETYTRLNQPIGENNQHPAWSANGRRIAFKHNVGEDLGTEIFVTEWDPGSSTQGPVTRLTDNEVADEFPDWSPMDDRLAWAFDSWPEASGGIIVHNFDTMVQDTLTDVRDNWPLWSPDGTMIAFWRRVEGAWRDHDLFVMNADGSGVRPLTEGPYYFPGPAHPAHGPGHSWSPDGSMIAITDLKRDPSSENSEIFLVPVNGGDPIPFTGSESSNRWGAWSQDGAWIVFQSDRDGTWSLWIRNVLTGEERTLTDGGGNDQGPVWAGSG